MEALLPKYKPFPKGHSDINDSDGGGDDGDDSDGDGDEKECAAHTEEQPQWLNQILHYISCDQVTSRLAIKMSNYMILCIKSKLKLKWSVKSWDLVECIKKVNCYQPIKRDNTEVIRQGYKQ